MLSEEKACFVIIIMPRAKTKKRRFSLDGILSLRRLSFYACHAACFYIMLLNAREYMQLFLSPQLCLPHFPLTLL